MYTTFAFATIAPILNANVKHNPNLILILILILVHTLPRTKTQ